MSTQQDIIGTVDISEVPKEQTIFVCLTRYNGSGMFYPTVHEQLDDALRFASGDKAVKSLNAETKIVSFTVPL